MGSKWIFGDHFVDQDELRDLIVISEYGDVFVAFGMATTSHMRRSFD